MKILTEICKNSCFLIQKSLVLPNPKRQNQQSATTVCDKHPLNNIKVLDLTRIIAGPYCTMVLADMGAQVIKVERPFVGGDETRKWGPPFMPNGVSTYFLSVNRNKHSICIDLKKGKDILYELAKKCDVLVENYVPGKLDKFGLGYEQIQKVAPQLIYCSITGYGPSGPYAKRPGYDVIAASVGGLMHITGERDGPPSKVGVPMTDIATGLYAHGAILAALLQRERTGCGQKIDVNLLSTQVAMLINVASNYLNSGVEAQRWGTAHSSIVPYQSFRTSDGYLTLGAGSDDQFIQMCQLLKIENLATDARFKTNSDRVQNRQLLINTLEKVFATKTTKDWMDLLQSAPFPVGPVNTIQQVFEDEHIKAIGLVKNLSHSQKDVVKVVGPPVIFSESLNDARAAPPTVGQHTDEILQNLLNYSPKQIKDLRDLKVIA